MKPLIETNSLAVFLDVADSLNMSVAAKKLKMTQSAVSQQIKLLEQQLGLVLFDREVRPMQLTASGKTLKQRGQNILTEIEQTLAILKQCAGHKLTELRVGLMHSFSEMCLPLFIKGLQQFVDKIQLRSFTSAQLIDSLNNREVDLAISADITEDITHFESYPLMREPFVILYPGACSVTNKVDLQYIVAKRPFITLPFASSFSKRVLSYLRLHVGAVTNIMEVMSITEAISMVEADLGWTISTPLMMALGSRHNTLKCARVATLPEPWLYRDLVLYARYGELGKLPLRIADLAREILAKECLDDMRRIVPSVQDKIMLLP